MGCVDEERCSVGEIKGRDATLAGDINMEHFGGLEAAVGWPLGKLRKLVAALFLENLVDSRKVLREPGKPSILFSGYPSGGIKCVGHDRDRGVELGRVIEDTQDHFDRPKLGCVAPYSFEDFGPQVGERSRSGDAPKSRVGHLGNGNCGMNTLFPVAGDRNGVNLASRDNRIVKLGIGMGVRMLSVGIYGFADEHFRLVNSSLATSEPSGPYTLSVLEAGGVERCFVRLESVPSVSVELVNVHIGFF